MTFNEIPSVLRGKDKISILPHVSVDGDGLGSSLALALALGKLGKKVRIYLEEKVPLLFEFLPGLNLIEVYDKNSEAINEDTQEDKLYSEVTVAIDTGDEGRLGNRLEIFKGSEVTINIDHHATNSMFAQYNHVQINSSSVGELIYELIKELDIEIDMDISACLYVAILTDTGGFRYSNTTSKTHLIVSDLINKGIDISDISKRIFSTNSYEKIKLMGLAISAIELFENGKIAITTITDDIIKTSGSKDDDSEGLVDIGRSIRGVEVSALLRELDDGIIKVNLRSNTYVDVSEIAAGFSGGGHKRAAGCKISGRSEDVKQKLIDEIRTKL